MKALFTILAAICIGLFIPYDRSVKSDVFAKPVFASVVVKDERSFCDKISQMYLVDRWEALKPIYLIIVPSITVRRTYCLLRQVLYVITVNYRV